MGWILIGSFLISLSVIILVVAGFWGRLIQNAYYQGQRDGLRQAAELLRDYGDDNLRTAPEGQMQAACVQAMVSHSLSLEVRGLINRVGRM